MKLSALFLDQRRDPTKSKQINMTLEMIERRGIRKLAGQFKEERKCEETFGSDDKADPACGRDNEASSKKDKRSLSAKLADAAKARLSPSVSTKMGNENGEQNWDQKRRKEKERTTESVYTDTASQNRSRKGDLKQRAGGSGRKPENSSDRRKKAGGEGVSSGSSKQAGNKAKVRQDARDYWAEVYLPKEKRWIVVDLLTGSVNHPEEIESRCSKPVTYCLAVNQGKVKDVTAR